LNGSAKLVARESHVRPIDLMPIGQDRRVNCISCDTQNIPFDLLSGIANSHGKIRATDNAF